MAAVKKTEPKKMSPLVIVLIILAIAFLAGLAWSIAKPSFDSYTNEVNSENLVETEESVNDEKETEPIDSFGSDSLDSATPPATTTEEVKASVTITPEEE